MKTYWILFLFIIPFICAYPQSNISKDITFSEVMFNPSSTNSEFVEIYNLSQSDTVDLSNFKIKYQSSSPDTILNAGKGTLLPPKTYGIIFESDYDFSTGKYNGLIAASAIVLRIHDNAFGSSGMSNTADRTLCLQNSLNDTIDVYTYSANNPAGISDEKLMLNKDNTALNWTNSSKINGTPGSSYETIPVDNALEISEINISPPMPVQGEEITYSFAIKNKARYKTGPVKIEIYKDLNFDSLGSSNENLLTYTISALNPGDSVVVEKHLSDITDGIFQLLVVASCKMEEDSLTFRKIVKFQVRPVPLQYNAIVINEIMYAPTSDEPEWVEIYNRSEKVINLKKWKFSDNSSSVLITNKDQIISPGEYVVLCRDTSIAEYFQIFGKLINFPMPTLNNSGDKVALRDSTGGTIDSLIYLPSWGGSNGNSLERVDISQPATISLNWKTSCSGKKATPWQINSVAQKDYDLAVKEVHILPIRPLIGDSIGINIKIVNDGKKDTKEASIQIFLSEASSNEKRAISEFPNITLHSRDSANFFLAKACCLEKDISLYVRVLFPMDEDTTNNSLECVITPGYKESAIQINELMYSPEGNEPEWFEIINTSKDIINLKNWSFSTLSSKVKYKLSVNDLLILPEKYKIITKDSSIADYYPGNTLELIAMNFKAFNNSSDEIVLYDSWGNAVDSLKFRSSWGGKKGRSLERFSLKAPTCDSTNWTTSIDKMHATPCQDNSAIDLQYYSRNSVVVNEIMYEPSASNCEFIELFNCSNDQVDLANWQIITKNGGENIIANTHRSLSKGEYFVIASDSNLIRSYPYLAESQFSSLTGYSPLNLHNTEDRVEIKDAFGNIIDSVLYSSKWHNKNILERKDKSLERVNPYLSSNASSNWSTSVSSENATPGRVNSIYVLNQKADKKFSILPNPFSPDNDGHEDFTIVNYNLDENVTSVRIKIFDSRGRLVRILYSQVSGPHGSIIFDGLDDHGNPLGIGIYILLLEELSMNSITLETIKSVVVVARKL